MANLKDLRSRIKSVKNTKAITATMKMVAAAKVRKAREACEAAEPYANSLQKVLANLTKGGHAEHPLFSSPETDHTPVVRLIVMGSDRGLCGGFNGNVLRKALQETATLEEEGFVVQWVAVGRKMKEGLKNADAKKLVAHYELPAVGDQVAFVEDLAASARNAFEAEEVTEVKVVYNRFVSMMTQTPTVQNFLPIAPQTLDVEAEAMAPTTEFEPSTEAILDTLLPLQLTTQLLNGLLASAAGEQAARMTAMDNATRNAGEMIKDLNLTYNRSRQAAITKELIEIISGAEAV